MNYRFTLLLGVLLLAAITAFSVDTPPAMYGNNTSPEYYTESNTPVTLFPAFEINGGSIDGGGIAFPIKGLTISFTAGHHNDQDNLSIPNNPLLGISGSFDKSTGVLRLKGETSAQHYQAFVRGIKYFNDAEPAAVNYDQRELTISFANDDYLDSNGHFYEYINDEVNLAKAKAAASAKTYYGLQGYLSTITSAEENSFITDKTSAIIWLDASDKESDGTWKWLSGPESGDELTYFNWASGEPNGGTSENNLMIYPSTHTTLAGKWNDIITEKTYRYVVEYGGMTGDPTINMTTTTTLNVVAPQPPVINGHNDSPTYNTSEYNPVHVFPNFTVTDAEDSDIKGLTIYFSSGYQSNQDTLLFTNTSKIEGYFDDTQGALVLLGDASPDEYQAAMRSITYVNNAPLFSLIDGSQREFTISLANADYFSQDLKLDNGHFYEYVNTPVEWIEAKAAASAKTYYGLKGYLATVTSENEKDFILSISDGTEQALWLGGSDEATPDTWKWVTGPEDGTIFYKDGAVVSGKYENWSTGQPDDAGSVETSLQFFTSNGTWNDRQNGYTSGYIVEYGGMDGDPTINMTTTTTLKIDVVRPEAPGGIVDNLRVWFNANSGTSITNGNITSWEGQKPYGVNTTTVNDVAGDPSVVPNSANYNSVVSFDEDDAIRTTSRVPYTTYFNASSDRNTTFLVKKSTKGNVEAGYAYANGVTTERAGYFERAAGYQRSDYGKDKTILAGSTTMINKYIIARQDVQPGDFSLYLDGALERQIDKFSSLAGSSEGYLGFGANPDDFSFQSATDIAEYIIYASDLSPTEIKEVESYLALKYGISLNQTVATNYLASDGTVIWSATDNAGYATDIFGIGQDNASGLNQKVSRSVNNNNSPVLSTTANFSLSNADASRTALGEGNFMVMGHNNGTENSFTSSFNGGTNNRTDRVWKVEETGTVEDVYFAIPYAAVTFPSGGTPSVIISDDENFDDRDQVLPLTYNRTQGGYYARINPDDGDYIALAISEISVTLPTFYRTESIEGETTGITSYPSYSDFINNTNSTYTTFSQHWNFDDSFFADGVYFYRTNNAKTTVTRYPSLADLAAGTNGIVYNFTSGGSPQDWNDDDEFFASGDQFFRTASSNSLEKSTGLTAYNSFADLMTNTNGTFYAFTVNFNFEDQFFHDGEYFYRTNTHQSNNTQFGVARYASLSDLVASKTIDSPTFGPWSTNDDIFAVGITASFTVSKDTLTMAENAGKGEFTVVLDARPSTDVVLDIASDDTNEATVDKGQLTFTPDNWKVAQTITVTGVDDYIIRNDSAIVTVSVNTSSDNTFAALANQSVEIILEDDDVAGFTLSESTLIIDEDAGTASFTVVLNTQPISNVVFDVSSDDDNEAIVDNGTLTFTSGDWDTPQTITVTGVNDEIDREDDATITVSVDAASSDDTYDGEEDQTVAVTLTDDDEAPTVSTTAASSVISTSGVLGGNVSEIGTSAVTETGVVYSTINTSPEKEEANVTVVVIESETGTFSETIASLLPDTTYYYQAYAISNAGISYGGVESFKTKQVQTITFNELAEKTYGDSDFDPTATASSNLTIAYSSSDTTVATIVDGNIHIVGAGSCTIYADQSGDDTYDAAIQVSQPLTVNKKPVTVTAEADQSKVYGESDPTLTYATSEDLETGDSFSGVLSRVPGDTVGIYAITIGTLSAGSNYDLTFESKDFTINKKSITVTAEADQSKVYGESDPTLTYATSEDLETGDSFSGVLSRVPGDTVGIYAITIGTLSAGSNYDLTFESKDFTINKKSITVTAEADQSKVYGESDPTLTYATSEDLETGDSFSGVLSRVPGDTVGIYAITIGTLSAGSNYDLTFESKDFTINKKSITVTAEADQSKVYGESDPTLTYATSEDLETGDSFSGVLSRVPGDTVGIYAITIGTLSAGSNYDLTFESKDFTINKKSITVTAEADQSKVYGESDPTLTYATSEDLETGDSFSGVLSRVPGDTVGTYAITIGTLSAGSNYDLTFESKDFTITEKAITVTADAKSKVYGETEPALTYQITAGALVGDDALTGSLSRATGEDVGTYAIAIGTLSAGSNYDLTFESNDFTITEKAITVTADAKSKVYGETEPALTYQITAGALVGDDALTGSLSRATGENVGTYAIAIGTLSAGSNYDLTFVSKDFTITEKAITVTADAKSKVYGETEPALTYQITAGALVGDDALTGNLSRTSGENVGTYAIAIGTLSAGSNYDLTFESNDFTITEKAITVTADAKSKVYGETEPALIYQITAGALVGDDALTGSLSRATGENVGTYAIAIGTLSAGSNYDLTFESNDFTITEKAITVTADAKSKVYGETEPALTYQITAGALVGDDALTGSLSRATGENVGTYAIAIGTLSAGSNYDLTFESNDFTITEKAITVTADAKSKVYGETEPALTYQITAGALVGDDALTGNLSRTSGENVGTYAIAIGTLSAGSNYDLTFESNDFTITEKAITVTADAKSKVYGETEPALTYQITAGALVGDDALTGSLSRATGENVGTYAIAIGTLSAGSNYDLTFESNDFTITEKAITVTADAKSKVYGETEPALTYQITAGALVGDDALTGSLSRATGENVGTYAIAIGTLSAGSNYDLTFESNDFTITEKAITVTADAKSKVYGETEPALTYQITAGALVGDDALTGSLSRATGENVGTYAIAIGTLSAGSNYDLTFESNDFTITEKAITVTADAKSKVYGETEPALTYQITAGALVGDDALTGSLSRATGENVGTYAIAIGTLSAGSNYDLTFESNDFTITEKAITVTADAKSKVYGETEPALTYQITAGALVGGDALTGSLSRDAGEDVGSYPITIGSLSAGTNYDFTFESSNFTINKKTITATAADKSKTYGEDNPELTFTYSGFVNGDNESDLTKAPVASTEATAASVAGNYKITVAGGVDENYTFTYNDATLTIEKATLTVTATAKDKSYDGTTTASITLSDDRVSGDMLTIDTTSAEFEDKNVGEGKTVTVAGIILSGDDANNYELSSVTVSATADITPKNLTVSNAIAQNKIYDGTTDAVISGAVLKGVVLNDDVQLENETIGTFAQSTLGNDIEVTTSMTLSGVDAPNYLLVQPTGLKADITGKELTITGTFTVSDKEYDGTTNATVVTNNLELSGIEGEDDVTLSNVVIAFETASAGSELTVKVVSADLTGDAAAQYSLSLENSPTATASILLKEVTLSGANGITKTYDGNILLPSGTAAYGELNGILAEDETQVELTGNPLFDLADAGDRVIVQGNLRLTGSKADNYTFAWTDGTGEIEKATLTVVANNDAKFVTLEDEESYAGVSISGYVNGENSSVINQTGLTITRSNATENSAGEYTDVLEASGLTADNYVFNYLPGDYSIIPAEELLVEINDTSIAYSEVSEYGISSVRYLDSDGNTIKNLTENVRTLGNNQFSVDDGVGNVVSFTISEIDPEYNSQNNRLAVGAYQLEATAVSGSSNNFNNTIHVTGVLTVTTKEVEVQLVSGSEQKAFDGDANMDNLDMFTSDLVNGDDVELLGNGSFSQSEAGTDIAYSVTFALQGADKDNYHLKTDVPLTGNDGKIAQIELTVTDAKASNKVYDGTTTATITGATLNGAITGDDVTLANENTGAFVTDAVGNDIEILTSMTLAGADKDNYVLIQPSGLKASIEPQELTVVNAAAKNKIYDGTTDATIVGATLSGVITDDEVLLENAESGTFKQDIVGTEIEVTTAMTISGADASNYYLIQPIGITADITTRELTVKDAVAESKIYDGTVNAVVSGAVLDGYISGDDVILANSTVGTFMQNSVGENIQVVTLMTLEGDDKDNYTLKQPSYLTANITAAELTLSGSFVVNNKEYDGTAIATMLENNLQFNGLASGDIVSLDSIMLAFETSNAGTGLEVYITEAKISGSDASKYSFSLNGAPVTSASINKKELTVTADNKTKEYDGSGYSSFTVSYNGFIDGEDQTNLSGALSFTGTATTAINAGTDYTITPGGLSSENYAIVYVDGYLDIHKVDQTITFNPISQQILSNSSFELSAVASSGLTIEYFSSDESIATVSGKIVTFINSGTCTIYANQPGNVNYNAAEQVLQTLTIIPYISGDSNHDGKITPPEIAGDSNEDGQINDGEVAGDTNGDGKITEPEVAGDTDGNGQINDNEVAGDNNGDGKITEPEVAGDTDGNGQIDNPKLPEIPMVMVR